MLEVSSNRIQVRLVSAAFYLILSELLKMVHDAFCHLTLHTRLLPVWLHSHQVSQLWREQVTAIGESECPDFYSGVLCPDHGPLIMV